MFRARTAGRAFSLRKALALPVGSRRAQRAPHAPPPRRPLPGPGRSPPALGGGPWLSRPIPPLAWHGTAGSAKGGGRWGSGREHVRQVRNGSGVPQVHVDPQKGSARGACAFV